MARASIYTLLSLDRYAKILEINPIRFNTADTPDINEFPNQGCDDIWFQYGWQRSDNVSREHLARTIHNAEQAIANKVGFYPAPVWIEEEEHQYPDVFARDAHGLGIDTRGAVKGLSVNYARYISGGRRALISVGEAAKGAELVFSDEDGDGFDETATITLAIPADVPDDAPACQFKTYFDGYDTPNWEIRYPNSAEKTGGNIVLTFDSWLFIKPNLWEAFPTTEGSRAINISDTTNYVDAVDVYYEYNDFSQASAQFIWETGSSLTCDICGGTGCQACGLITQDGCAKASNAKEGFIRPMPATYDSDDENWNIASFSENIEPDMVKVWYYSGEKSQEYIKGNTCDPLSHFWAETIAILATARLKRIIADCPGVKNTVEHWQTDLSKIKSSVSYFQQNEVQESPFGTRRGEVMAWRRIKHFVPDKKVGVALIS